MTMTKVLSEQGSEASDFDNVLLPITTRSLSEFNNTYPFRVKQMLDDQLADAKLQKEVLASIRKKKVKCSYKEVEGVKLIHKNGKILVPKTARQCALDWYYKILAHPGRERMYSTIHLVFYWNGLKADFEKILQTVQGLLVSKKD